MLSHTKRCHCCDTLLVIYKKRLRKNMLAPLLVLSTSDTPLTAQELAGIFADSPALAIEITKHFASLRLFGLIYEASPQHYAVTRWGIRFLHGHVAVPEWVWTLKNEPVATPDGEQDAPLRYIHEISPKDFSDRRGHVEDAAPMVLQPLPF